MKKASKYAGQAGEVIAKLRAEGHNTDWWDKPKVPSPRLAEAEACGYFTIYLATGQTLWTITYDGQKYMVFKTLDEPVSREEHIYVCTFCKKGWKSIDQARKHYSNNQGEL